MGSIFDHLGGIILNDDWRDGFLPISDW